jgi:hypothetical protein
LSERDGEIQHGIADDEECYLDRVGVRMGDHQNFGDGQAFQSDAERYRLLRRDPSSVRRSEKGGHDVSGVFGSDVYFLVFGRVTRVSFRFW